VSGLEPLDRFNRLPEEEAATELLAVCHSRRWAKEVAVGRPYADLAAFQQAADRVWLALGPDDWLEAFAAHPRIGEGGSGGPPGWSPGGSAGGASPGWSRHEQAGVAGADRDVQERLARGTAEYEARFGHVFLISAAGRDATEILAALTERLGNDPATELRVAADEHRRITRLRLERLMQG
jgi:OHCU decarboxylase